ncbi:MAG: hypothetical protein RBS78_00995 [Coriobacteriia bacterium]|jgi:hypothetical protein|nr:hypothetical protein [Coriobacteriia bacterium]
MGVEYTSPGATRHFYGPRLSPATKPDPAPAVESVAGNKRQLEIRFSYDNLPDVQAVDALVKQLPAYAVITDAYLQVEETFLGGTSYVIGTETPAGVAVDVDGLFTAAQCAVANLVAGYCIHGRGEQIVGGLNSNATAGNDVDGVYAAGANGPIASVASQIVVTPTGDFTAGRARIVVEYLDPQG